ncbi:MAG: hypothetical protein PVG39_09490 [Desulfobacteraceae bacterium]
MAQFQSYEKDIEVTGQAVLAFVEGMGIDSQKALQVLKKNGLTDIKPEKWYSHQSLLNAFKQIAETVGPHALYSMGTKIHENAKFPPGLDSLEKALESIDIAYHMNHRGGEIGNYKLYKSPDGGFYFKCNNPYPCEFDRGIIEGLARKFTTEGHFIKVKHDDSAPCRDRGDDFCTYYIEIF